MDDHRPPQRAENIIGEKVRNKRIADGLSEEAVARALKCDVKELRAAESGKVRFKSEDIVELCTILRVTPSWFFEELI